MQKWLLASFADLHRNRLNVVFEEYARNRVSFFESLVWVSNSVLICEEDVVSAIDVGGGHNRYRVLENLKVCWVGY